MSDIVKKVEREFLDGDGRPKLPNMNEFSPGTLDTNSVRRVLGVLQPHQANKEGAINALIDAFPKLAATKSPSQRALRAANVLIGMSQCGLLKSEAGKVTSAFTDLAQSVLAQVDEMASSDYFSRHLLESCHGLELLDVVAIIRARAEPLTLEGIRDELRSRGFLVTENETTASKIRLWLEASGLVDSHWAVNDTRLHDVGGARHETIGKWSSLTRPQRVFAEAIRRISLDDKHEWIRVRQIKRLCETEWGRKIFPEGHLRGSVIEPLVDAGWIEAEGKGAGRGGDSGRVRGLPQLCDLRLRLPLDSVSGIPVDLRDKLSIPRERILLDLRDPDTYTKGVALELLALRLCRDVGLFPVGFRERSNKTQGAEVDLIADGVHLHYSRWLVQCKNTPNVEMKDLAKEIGMAVLLKAHVIVLVTTGRFRRTVIDGAKGLSATSGLQAVLIDGALLERYRAAGGGAVIEWLNTSAMHVMDLKSSQLRDMES